MINAQIGAALLDYWTLSPLEIEVLAMASRGQLTEKEEKAKQADDQRALAAALSANFCRPAKPA